MTNGAIWILAHTHAHTQKDAYTNICIFGGLQTTVVYLLNLSHSRLHRLQTLFMYNFEIDDDGFVRFFLPVKLIRVHPRHVGSLGGRHGARVAQWCC